MKVDIIFGSESDASVYQKAYDMLGSFGWHPKIHIISAHRDPEALSMHLKESEADFYIAGAGLAAHLPGVIASQTEKPVIGIPVAGNFDGLDAFLSIVQMPKGVPVLCTWVDNLKELPSVFETIKSTNGVNSVIEASLEEHQKDTNYGLRVPVLNEEEKHSVESALKFFELSKKKGLWLGANRKENADLFLEKLRRILC